MQEYGQRHDFAESPTISGKLLPSRYCSKCRNPSPRAVDLPSASAFTKFNRNLLDGQATPGDPNGMKESQWHRRKLRHVQWLYPIEPALGEHFKSWPDASGISQAADRDKYKTGKGFQIRTEQASAAVRAKVSIKFFPGFGYVRKRFWRPGQQSEIAFGYAEKRGESASAGSLAVIAIAVRNELRIGVEFERDLAAGALALMLLAHVASMPIT
jgi:hypothetical protein